MNPYAVPAREYVQIGENKIPTDEYFNKYAKQIYEMLPFSQGKDAMHYNVDEKLNMAKGMLEISKGSNKDNMFLCGMDMAQEGEKQMARANQRVYWDALHKKRSEYTDDEYNNILHLIEQGNITQCSRLINPSES